MYFYKEKNRRHLDLSGNLILSRNASPVAANVGSAVPKLSNGVVVRLVGKPATATSKRIPAAGKVRASLTALRFIWGPHAVPFVVLGLLAGLLTYLITVNLPC